MSTRSTCVAAAERTASSTGRLPAVAEAGDTRYLSQRPGAGLSADCVTTVERGDVTVAPVGLAGTKPSG